MKNIHSTYKFRIYPTEVQEILLSKHFGAVRFIYNHYLNKQKQHYLNNKEEIEAKRVKGNSNFFQNCKDLTQLKKQEEFSWLKEINSQSLQHALNNLDTAYAKFFRKEAQFPVFKSKHNNHQSFTVSQNTLLEGYKLFIPKFKEGIKIKQHRKIEGKILYSTISRTPANKYFVSVTVEREMQEKSRLTKEVGIDLGIKDFCICSDSTRISNPKHLYRLEKKLKFKQKELSKKKKGSKNRNKQRLKVARIHERISNSRLDFLHKLSSKLVNENQVIYLEDLNVKGMVKNHKLAKAISDCSWSKFLTLLKYKSDWNDRQVVQIDRFFPSSKTCSHCGWIKQDLTLKDRDWVCSSCNASIDRDLNASLNILKQGRLVNKKL